MMTRRKLGKKEDIAMSEVGESLSHSLCWWEPRA
jgi:hypothetical protein